MRYHLRLQVRTILIGAADGTLTDKKHQTRPKKGKPMEIPVPKRGEVFDAIEKVAGRPGDRKHPAEKDQPPSQPE